MATASIGQITEHVFIVHDADATLVGLKSELTTGRLRDSNTQLSDFLNLTNLHNKVLFFFQGLCRFYFGMQGM